MNNYFEESKTLGEIAKEKIIENFEKFCDGEDKYGDKTISEYAFKNDILPEVIILIENQQKTINELKNQLDKKNSDIAADKFGWK